MVGWQDVLMRQLEKRDSGRRMARAYGMSMATHVHVGVAGWQGDGERYFEAMRPSLFEAMRPSLFGVLGMAMLRRSRSVFASHPHPSC